MGLHRGKFRPAPRLLQHEKIRNEKWAEQWAKQPRRSRSPQPPASGGRRVRRDESLGRVPWTPRPAAGRPGRHDSAGTGRHIGGRRREPKNQCKSFLAGTSCPYGDRCPFAHGNEARCKGGRKHVRKARGGEDIESLLAKQVRRDRHDFGHHVVDRERRGAKRRGGGAGRSSSRTVGSGVGGPVPTVVDDVEHNADDSSDASTDTEVPHQLEDAAAAAVRALQNAAESERARVARVASAIAARVAAEVVAMKAAAGLSKHTLQSAGGGRLNSERLWSTVSSTQAKPLIMAKAEVLDAWWTHAELRACRASRSINMFCASFVAEMDEKHLQATRQLADGSFDHAVFDRDVAARLRWLGAVASALLLEVEHLIKVAAASAKLWARMPQWSAAPLKESSGWRRWFKDFMRLDIRSPDFSVFWSAAYGTREEWTIDE